MRLSDWSSDVCSSDLKADHFRHRRLPGPFPRRDPKGGRKAVPVQNDLSPPIGPGAAAGAAHVTDCRAMHKPYFFF